MSTQARLWTVGGLLAGAAGTLWQKAAGVDMPVVPPGLVLLVVAAGLMLHPRWRWPAVAAVLVAFAELGGMVGSGMAARLVEVGRFGEFASTWLRLAGVVVAVIAGTVATVAAYRRPVVTT